MRSRTSRRCFLSVLLAALVSVLVTPGYAATPASECQSELAKARRSRHSGQIADAVDSIYRCLASLARKGVNRQDDEDRRQACDLRSLIFENILSCSAASLNLPDQEEILESSPVPFARTWPREGQALLALECLPDLLGRDCLVQLRDAKKFYDAGQFDKVHDELAPCVEVLPKFQLDEYCGQGNELSPSKDSAVRAWALLAKTHIALDEKDTARRAVDRLVLLDPGFEPEDPLAPREFVKLLEQARRQPLELDTDVCDDFVACLQDPQRGRWEVGIVGGFFLPDEDVSGKSESFGETEPFGGLSLAYFFAERWDWFVDITLSDINRDRPSHDVQMIAARGGVEFFKSSYRTDAQWVFSFSGGWMEFEVENVGSFHRPFVSAGIGQRLTLDRRAHFRWQLRADQTLGNAGFDGNSILSFQGLIGLAWTFGASD